MKIAQIVPSLEASKGGPSRSVKGLSEGLARTGAEVELLTTGPLESEAARTASSLKIHAFRRQWPDPIARSAQLDDHLRGTRFDIVHSHGLWQRPLHYARLTAQRCKAPLIVSPRGMMTAWAWNHHRWKKALSNLTVHPGALAAATGWHATSAAEADDVRHRGFSGPVCVAPNGVVPPSNEEEAAAAGHWNARLAVRPGVRLALFYSRFHSKKRVLELIDLWLAKPRDGWVLLLAGITEQYSVNQLDAYILRNGGTGRVIVHDGADAPPPYAIASVFLLPSHSENFGLVIAEALVRGLPVLTTDSTPWHELSARGAGDCVPWEKFGPVLDSLLALEQAELSAMGERARAWATASFSWDQTAAILLDFYRRLLNAR